VPLEALYLCSVNLRNPDGMIPWNDWQIHFTFAAQSVLARVVDSVFATFNKELIF